MDQWSDKIPPLNLWSWPVVIVKTMLISDKYKKLGNKNGSQRTCNSDKPKS